MMANTQFSAKAEISDSLVTKVTSRQFSFTLDEPPSLGGTDAGMNPVEALLGALGGCKCIVARAFAKAQGINLKGATIECTGILDPDGFLGKNPDAKIGFSKIHTVFRFDADNTAEELEKFVDFIESHCPVQDTLTNPADSTHEIAA